MNVDWYSTELHARQLHADHLRQAARDRLVDEVLRTSRASREPGRLPRLLHHLGGKLIVWGGQLRAPTAGPRPATEPAGG